MVTLVIEDGTGKADANTYISLADARAYAESRGITLPTDDDALSVDLINGADFLNTYECKFAGVRSFPATQALAFPRTGIEAYGNLLDPDAIPTNLKNAQVALAGAVASGVDLFPSQTGAAVKRRTVGPLTQEFDTGTWIASDLPVFSQVESLLSSLFEDCSCGVIWRTVRV